MRSAAVLLTAVLLFGCSNDENIFAPSGSALSATDAAALSYVGMTHCAACHANETANWLGSHHYLAMAPMNETTVLGDFNDAVFLHGDKNARFYQRDGRYFVFTDDLSSEPAEFELSWTFGWEPLQQYLIAFPDGRLQALPFAWDTRASEAGGQRWFHVYGDESILPDDELHWTKPAQNWNYMCADCHVTGYAKNYDPATDNFVSAWSEINVACEACHGPGSLHVARAHAEQLGEGHGFPLSFAATGRERILRGGATTVSLVGADNTLQVEACGQCHARRAPISETYHHGKPLLDSYLPVLLSEGLYFPDGQILDEVFEYGSFRQSRMYAAGVVCTDCHEPHSLKLRAEGDALCSQCHLASHYRAVTHTHHEAGPAAPSCRDCHMPARNYMVVDSRRDHSFRVPRPDLTLALGVPNACANCHAEQGDAWSAEAVRSWLGRDAQGMQNFAHSFADARAGKIAAADSLHALLEDRTQPAIVRATALTHLASYPGPETVQAAILALRDPDPAVRLAALGPVTRLPDFEQLRWLKPLWSDPVRAVRMEAARLVAGIDNSSLSEKERAQFLQALDDYVAAQRASLDRPTAWLNLGNLSVQMGDSQLAEQQYREALARDASFAPAYVHLAEVLSRRGDEVGAGTVLLGGLRQLPDSAALHHALGLQQVRLGKGTLALAAFAKAAALAPQDVRFHYVYAIALHGEGKSEEAITVLENIHAIHEADQEVLHGLISMHMESGNSAAAQGYANQLFQLRPWDTQLQMLLQQLEQN